MPLAVAASPQEGGGGVSSSPESPELSFSLNADQLTLSWEPINGADSYIVYKSRRNSSTDASADDPQSSTSYLDSIPPNSTFYYWVKACNTIGCSALSNGIEVRRNGGDEPVTPLVAPTDLSADADTNSVTLKWRDLNGDDTQYYLIYRHTSDNTQDAGDPLLTQSRITTAIYLDSSSSLVSGTSYYYWIRACNNSGCSNYSTSVSVTVDTALPALSFSDPDNTADSIVGMREFLLTASVAAGSLTTPQDYTFIVTTDETPPAWSEVANHPAKLTRRFSSTNNSREIYFSLTNSFTGDAKHFIDVSADNEAELIQPLGFMTPATDYYVHAYARQALNASSGAITTVDYPDTFPQTTSDADWSNDNFPDNPYRSDNKHSLVGPYQWAMEMWLLVDDTRTIEVRNGEKYYLPVRIVAASSQNGAVGCGGNQIS